MMMRKFSQPSLQAVSTQDKENTLRFLEYPRETKEYKPSFYGTSIVSRDHDAVSESEQVLQSQDLNSKTTFSKRSSIASMRHSDDLVEIGQATGLLREQRRRLSQSHFEQELAMIRQQQRDREQELIEKAKHIKEMALQHRMSQTQIYNGDNTNEQRMQRFESMIELLIDKTGLNSRFSQTQGQLEPRQDFHGSMVMLPSTAEKLSFAPSHRDAMQRHQQQQKPLGVQTLTVNLQDDHFMLGSSASTHDQRNLLLAQDSHRSKEDQKSQRVKNTDEAGTERPPYRQQILTSDFNPSKLTSVNKRQPQQLMKNDLEDFMHTLQTIEDYTKQPQTPEDLSYLKERLVQYRAQLAQPLAQGQCKTKEQAEIVEAIDQIIAKMEIHDEKYVELKGQGVQESSFLMDEKSIMVLDSDFHVTPTLAALQQTTQAMDYERPDATDTSLVLSTRKSHMKSFNKSGYMVKHSRYLSSVDKHQYQVIQNPLETSEELKHDKSWLMEIKHLKALLSSITHNHVNDKVVNPEPKQNRQTLEPKATSSQCIIM